MGRTAGAPKGKRDSDDGVLPEADEQQGAFRGMACMKTDLSVAANLCRKASVYDGRGAR